MHEDYLPAPEDKRWVGSLAALWATLNAEVAEGEPEKWCWRVLPRGACVALRRSHGGGRTCRISRSKPTLTTAHLRAFAFEVEVFRGQFGIPDWQVRSEKGATLLVEREDDA